MNLCADLEFLVSCTVIKTNFESKMDSGGDSVAEALPHPPRDSFVKLVTTPSRGGCRCSVINNMAA